MNFIILNFISRCLIKEVIAIVNATAWQATDAQTAPFTPISGIGTRIKFSRSFTTTPHS